MSAVLPTAFYEPGGDGRWLPTELTRGPWDPGFQHAGPPAALLARAIEEQSTIDGGQTVRLSYDILRPVPIAPLELRARTLRGGKRVELLEATLLDEAGGTELMRATAWRMRAEAVALPGGLGEPEAPPPGPERGRAGRFAFWQDEVAYHRAFDWRFVAGDFDEPGPATAWTRLDAELVAGEPASPLHRLIAMADAASGISTVLDWAAYTFVNVDLGIHLERPPEGEWMGMDATTRLGADGAGLCTSVLFDERGRVGATTHSLLIAKR